MGELAKERDARLAEATKLGRGLQTLKGCVKQHLKDLKLSVDAERSNGITMHDRLAENLTQMKAEVNAQETLRLQTTHEMHDKVKKLSGELEAVRFGTESSTTSKSVCDLSDRLKRLSHELETEVQDRIVGDAAVRALVAVTQQELGEERDVRLAEATKLGQGLQTLKGCVEQHLKDLKLSVDAERSNGITMHDRLAENLTQMKAEVNAQETL